MTVFGPSWDDLTPEAIGGFLADSPTEGLEWEAKSEFDPASVRKAVCGFANSHDGGYLLLGATRRGDSWDLDGIKTPNADPASDVTDVIANGGVVPYPDGLNVRDFDVPGERSLVVVYVPPISTPPCLTKGTVFERLPGKTVPITEANRLAELFARGEAARDAAVRRAERMITRTENVAGVGLNVQELTVALGVPRQAIDTSFRRFSSEFDRFAGQHLWEILINEPSPHQHPGVLPSMTQFELVYTVEAADIRLGWDWLVCISRDGAAGVNWKPKYGSTSVRSFFSEGRESPAARAWRYAAKMLEALDLGKQSSLALHARLPDPAALDAFVARDGSTGPTDDALQSIALELRRAGGEYAYSDPSTAP